MAYTDEELKTWWLAQCPKCNWSGLSRDCDGGLALADTGDYTDIVCPDCWKNGDWVVVENIED